MEFVAIQNTYAESGTPEQLMEKYELTAPYIATAARRVRERKTAQGTSHRRDLLDREPMC